MDTRGSPASGHHALLRGWPRLLLAAVVCLCACGASPGSTAEGPRTAPRTGDRGAAAARVARPAAARVAPTDPRSAPAPPELPPLLPEGWRLAGRRVCVDPGHEAYWGGGATGRDRTGRVPTHPAGFRLLEYELTLAVSYRLARLLEAEGAQVCVTRREDGALQVEPYDYTGDGQVRPEGVAVEDSPELTQPRIDWVNRFGAEVLVSIHFNGSADRAVRGTEVYYSDTGVYAEQNHRLAQHLMAALLRAIDASGYPAVSRGVRTDRYQRYPPDVQARFRAHNAAAIVRNGRDPTDCADCSRLGVLGNNPMSWNQGAYAGALVEVEFLSNPAVVEEFLLRADSLDVIASGLRDGLLGYFGAA